MILITLKEQNGEQEYFSYHYMRSMTADDYYNNPNYTEDETNNLRLEYGLDVEIMTKLGYDVHEDNYEEDDGMWWFDTRMIGVDGIQNLSETRFKTLKELGILYE